ncbi:hypothetical protein IFR09_11185 [Pseudomonas syringae]|nr:hypothetical protein [Pseudomonas syringae]MBD8790942.1 hypothetical protein [Pseudomonas syringae]MBD8801922.1 hypothetical protein [Pseudomonas syringae]MBD8811728.1 hypothetical protein [Pseudomonas syringae]
MGKNILVFLLSAAAVAGAEASGPVPPECEILDGMAEAAMMSRQAGMPMIEMYKNADKAGPAIANIAKPVIAQAYRQPRYPDEKSRAAAVTDFRDKFFQGCLSNQK